MNMSHISLAILSAILAAPAPNHVEIRVLSKDDGIAIPKARVIVYALVDKDYKFIDATDKDGTDSQGRFFSETLASGKWSKVLILVAVPRELVPEGEPAARGFPCTVTRRIERIELRTPIRKVAQLRVWDESLGEYVLRTVRMRKVQYHVARFVPETRTRQVCYHDPCTGQYYEVEVPYTVYRPVWEIRERWVPILTAPAPVCAPYTTCPTVPCP